MRAVVMTQPGSPEVLQFVDIPRPEMTSPTQIRVRLRAAGVNPVDTKLRQRGSLIPGTSPVILGCDGAGDVTEVGSQVTRFQVGDPVFFCYGGIGLPVGCYAEEVVIEEGVAARKPDSLSFVEAAAIPLVLITAWEALVERGRLQPGSRVLIHGGAGGVGHMAIQIAKSRGARVCTTVSSNDKAAFVRSLGSDLAIVYPHTDWQQAVREWSDGMGVDLALDTVGGSLLSATCDGVRPYGDVVTLLQPTDLNWTPLRTHNLRLSLVWMLAPMLYGWTEALARQRQILEQCTPWLQQTWRVQVSQVFPLAQAAAAHALIEQGSMVGKVVLEV